MPENITDNYVFVHRTDECQYQFSSGVNEGLYCHRRVVPGFTFCYYCLGNIRDVRSLTPPLNVTQEITINDSFDTMSSWEPKKTNCNNCLIM